MLRTVGLVLGPSVQLSAASLTMRVEPTGSEMVVPRSRSLTVTVSALADELTGGLDVVAPVEACVPMVVTGWKLDEGVDTGPTVDERLAWTLDGVEAPQQLKVVPVNRPITMSRLTGPAPSITQSGYRAGLPRPSWSTRLWVCRVRVPAV